MESNDTYRCEKCGNTLLKSNKLLHDLYCEKNRNNNLNYNPYYNNINNNIIDINRIDTYTCNKCGSTINLKDKTDHLLCHQLEEENKGNNNYNNININRINNFPNIRNDDSESDEESDENDDEINVINNININIVNGNGNQNVHRNYTIVNGNTQINNDINVNNLIENDEADENLNDGEFDEFEEGDENNLENVNSLDEEDEDDDINGIDDQTINTFPVSKIKDITKLTEEKKKCCICLENYKKNDEIITLPCIHIFHSKCIKTWMKRQDICPICKNKII